jgi:hypothetical protein
MVETEGTIHIAPGLGRKVPIVGAIVTLTGTGVHLVPEGEVEQGVEIRLLGKGETGVRAVVVVSVRV